MILSICELRSRMYDAIRVFFKGRKFLEVETPALSPSLIPEPTIPYFETSYDNPFKGNRPLYLVPSPEVWMKRLLTEGSGDIFQICKCFRNREALGSYHNPEFSMLEWYMIGADYKKNIRITEELFRELAPLFPGGEGIKPPFVRLTMAKAFETFARIDLGACETSADLQAAASGLGLRIPPEDTWEETFNKIFLTLVEPNLPGGKPLILMDYPSRIPCLAKQIPGSACLERWELYVAGMELANCFTEVRDASAAAAYYREACGGKDEGSRSAARAADETYPNIFGPGFPACSGVALGLDRLLMVLTGASAIEEVLLFPFKKF